MPEHGGGGAVLLQRRRVKPTHDGRELPPERVGAVRHARERVGVVLGLVCVEFGNGGGDRSERFAVGVEPGGAGRELVRLRRVLPFCLPAPRWLVVPEQRRRVPPGLRSRAVGGAGTSKGASKVSERAGRDAGKEKASGSEPDRPRGARPLESQTRKNGLLENTRGAGEVRGLEFENQTTRRRDKMKLYQFFPIKNGDDIDHIKDALDGNIHLVDWRTWNDILEGVHIVKDNESKECKESIKKLYGHKRQLMGASFSQDSDEHGPILRNHLMWAHYASHHTGVAVQYDVCKEPVWKKEFAELVSVKYVASLGEAPKTPEDGSFGAAKELLSRKLKVWEYEQERRLLVGDACKDKTHLHGHEFFYNKDFIRPCHMYLGSRFLDSKNESPCALAGLLALCKKNNIDVSNVADVYPDIFMTLSDYDGMNHLDDSELPFANILDCHLARAIRELHHASNEFVEKPMQWHLIAEGPLLRCHAFQKVASGDGHKSFVFPCCRP